MSLDRIIPITLVFICHIGGIYVLQKHTTATVIEPQTQEIVVQLVQPTEVKNTAPMLPNISSKPRLTPKLVPHAHPTLASSPHAATTTPSTLLSAPPAPYSALAEKPDPTTPEHLTEPSSSYQAPLFNASYLNNPPPSYRPASRQMPENGTVILRVYVDIHGSASVVELRTSSGSKRLDNAAIEAVRHWRFVAAKLGNNAIAAWVLVPIVFQLDS